MRLDYTKVAPDGMSVLGGVSAYVGQSSLEEILIELVYLRVSQLCECVYHIDLHKRRLIEKGMSPPKVAAVQTWRSTQVVFDAREQAALAWTESVTQAAKTRVPDAMFNTAMEVFNEREIVDLTVAIGLMNVYNRIAISFRRLPENPCSHH